MEALNLIEIGNRIRKQREILSYSREELAETLDVSTKFCADIELGIKGMSIQTLSKLSQVLHISTDYILFGKNIDVTPNNLSDILSQLPKDKIRYAEDILSTFIKAIDN
ncbi:MAG: helix-turn-helix transcriptional regulator [Oscillospiraceae bacterium]|nr:helix-turn-helix transcriptional regulator [Oscillospiraceae bacterium]